MDFSTSKFLSSIIFYCWQPMESPRLSRRGLDAGGAPLAAVPVEAPVGGAAAAAALHPGPSRNTRRRNKRQRGEQVRAGRAWSRRGGSASGLGAQDAWVPGPAWLLTFCGA